MRQVLIVEDDEAMAAALQDGFTSEGYAVLLARDGLSGAALATHQAVDLMILDVMLPRLSGLDVCRQLRSAGNTLHIIMLTARGQEIDKVLGLKLGADDYLTKPFSFLELMARVEAVLRRTAKPQEVLDQAAFGDVVLHFATHQATKGGRPLALSSREFILLRYLLTHRGEVVSREQLLQAVCGAMRRRLSPARWICTLPSCARRSKMSRLARSTW